MITHLTVAEIVMLYGKPAGTVRWLASRDRWERSEDGRKPVLYRVADVRKTMSGPIAETTPKAAA